MEETARPTVGTGSDAIRTGPPTHDAETYPRLGHGYAKLRAAELSSCRHRESPGSDTMTTVALNPCPFCGSTDVGVTEMLWNSRLKHVTCGSCDASGPPRTKKADAIADWNRRALGRET